MKALKIMIAVGLGRRRTSVLVRHLLTNSAAASTSPTVPEPVVASAGWMVSDLEADPQSWRFELSKDQRQELLDALSKMKKDPKISFDLREVMGIIAEEYPVPKCAELLSKIQTGLRDGRGFCFLRNFPVEGLSVEEVERMYFLFCSHLGTCVTQNSDAGLIHYVTDGKIAPNMGKRTVGNPGKFGLHVDLTDVVSLLCVRQAPDGPRSHVVSSVSLYNEILRRYPEYLPRLTEGLPWTRMNEHSEGEEEATPYKVPIFSRVGDVVSSRYNRGWQGGKRPGLAVKSKEEAGRDKAIFEALDKIADELRFEFEFVPGDVQFCNNLVCFHGRSAHAFIPEEDKKRLLLRTWFDLPGEIRELADEAVMRYGIIRHGNLGYTAKELREGALEKAAPRPRRADGAPLPIRI